MSSRWFTFLRRVAGSVRSAPLALLALTVLVGSAAAQPASDDQVIPNRGPVVAAAPMPLNPAAIAKFSEPLPMPARLDATGTSGHSPLIVRASEFQQRVLPPAIYAGLPAPYDAGTFVWGYNGTFPGPTIEALRGVPATIRYVNDLRNPSGAPLHLQSMLRVDQTLHWADPFGVHPRFDLYLGPVPAVVHLHGGEVPSAFDGGPDAWWTPDGAHTGPAYVTDTFEYPNEQEPTTLWYHDHALGMTRLNVYAGLAGFYLLRDPAGEPAHLPGGTLDTPRDGFGNLYEREIVIQDRMFDTNGQLYWPNDGINPDVHPFWQPEFFGDVILVNGKPWPYLDVEPRRYRFRLLDGSNARFYELRLVDRTLKLPGPGFWQIGSDGGLLDAPVLLNDPRVDKPPRLLLAPGERADVVIDFAGYEGQTLVLVNGAKSPYPKGVATDPRTTGLVMQFRVGRAVTGGTDPSLNPALTSSLRPAPIERPAAPPVRRALTLNENMGPGGPLEMFVNNTMYMDGVSESMQAGDTEVWEIINLTADTHPIHLHLVQFQLLNRQSFNVRRYLGVYGMPMPGMGPPFPYGEESAATGFKQGGNPDVTPYLQGPVMPPDPNERGWKDTFRMNPGEVTRILVRVAPQDAAARAAAANTHLAPGVNLFAFEPWEGPGYVWHCHILEHEDNEMMRPLRVAAPTLAAASQRSVVRDPDPAPLRDKTSALELGPSVPNPVTGSARIEFVLPAAGPVDLRVYNVLGEEVSTLASGAFPAGRHSVVWNGRKDRGTPLAAGTYFYRLRFGSSTLVRKLALVP